MEGELHVVQGEELLVLLDEGVLGLVRMRTTSSSSR